MKNLKTNRSGWNSINFDKVGRSVIQKVQSWNLMIWSQFVSLYSPKLKFPHMAFELFNFYFLMIFFTLVAHAFSNNPLDALLKTLVKNVLGKLVTIFIYLQGTASIRISIELQPIHPAFSFINNFFNSGSSINKKQLKWNVRLQFAKWVMNNHLAFRRMII